LAAGFLGAWRWQNRSQLESLTSLTISGQAGPWRDESCDDLQPIEWQLPRLLRLKLHVTVPPLRPTQNMLFDKWTAICIDCNRCLAQPIGQRRVGCSSGGSLPRALHCGRLSTWTTTTRGSADALVSLLRVSKLGVIRTPDISNWRV